MIINSSVYKDNFIGTDGIIGYRWQIAEADQRLVIVLDYEPQGIDLAVLPEWAEKYVAGTSVDKISVRVPGHIAQVFIEHGYQIEASVPQYYEAGEPILFMARQLSARRLLASRNQTEAGYHLEFQYRTTQPEQPKDSGLKLIAGKADQMHAALDQYLAANPGMQRDVSAFITTESSVIAVEHEEIIKAVGVLLPESNRVGRIQGYTTVSSDEDVARAVIEQQIAQAVDHKLACVYSLTSVQEQLFNKTLPAMGFAFRGKLGADMIVAGEYVDRYVWSCNL